MAGTDVPAGIDRARHHDLAGRRHHVWWRRVVLAGIAAIPVLGLIGVFGQRAVQDHAQADAVSLLVNSPAHVRGGLVFTTEIAITPRRQLSDARLYLDQGWFEGMTLNGVSPQPSSEGARGRWQVWDFGQRPAGVVFRVWIAWQVNPTNVGHHPQDVALYDGGTRLTTVSRAVTVFP